jgi:hypothetical protein
LKRAAQIVMHGDASTPTLLGDCVVDRNRVGDLAARVEHHRPIEPSDFAGAQAGL